MPETIQSSFIPKKTVAEVAPQRRRRSAGILSILAIGVFVLSLLAAGGVFFYERYVADSITAKEETLNRAREAFELDLIRELSRTDKKINAAGDLLDKHTALSRLFELIERDTLKTVRFEDLSYEEDENGVHVQMTGEAVSFSSIALQSDQFGKNRSIKDPIFSDLNLDAEGNVTFTFTATIVPDILRYSAGAVLGENAQADTQSE